MYAYGSGISYTTFKYETQNMSLRVGKAAVDRWVEAGGHSIHFKQGVEAEDHIYVTVTNTGPVAGADVVQVGWQWLVTLPRLSLRGAFVLGVYQDANPGSGWQPDQVAVWL